jgi:hypothetical protein
MNISRLHISRALLPLATLVLVAGCAPTFEARVARFSALPPEPAKSFTIEARNPAYAGELEFATYANLVRKEMLTHGFVEAATPAQATVTVLLDYGVGAPQQRIETRPGSFNAGWGSAWGPGWGGRGWNPYWGSAWGPGWGWGGGWSSPEIYSVTEFNAVMALKMQRTADKASLFEGRAETVSRNNNLTVLMPNLVRAMFTQFPGNSGETVRVRFNPTRPDQPATVRVVN